MRFISWIVAVIAMPVALHAQDEDKGREKEREKVTLEWKFKKGESLRYEMGNSVETEFGGMEITQEQLFGYTMEVVEVAADGTATLKTVYDRIKFKIAGPMASEYDSAKDKEAPSDSLGKLMAALLGKSITMKLNPKGEILEVKGYAEVMEKVMKELEEDMPGTSDMFKRMFSDDQLKGMMQLSYGLLPKTPVAKGETWESQASFAMPMLGKLVLKHKSTLKEIQTGGQAVIDQETKMELKAEEGPMGALELSDSKFKSQMVWLAERGAMQSMKGTMTATMSANGQEFTVTTKIDMRLAPKAGAEKEAGEKK